MNILGSFPLVPGQLKFLIVGVDYFTIWINVEVFDKITIEKVHPLYWKTVMCRFRLLRAIVSENGTHFSSAMVTDLCQDLEV